MRLTFFIVTLLLLPVVSLSASLYKWRDSSGVLHITDTVPPSSAQEIVGGTYTRSRQSVSDRQQSARQNAYYDQLAERNYQDTLRQSAARDRAKQAEERRDFEFEKRKAYLEAQIYKYSRMIKIKDPVRTRNYYRQLRDDCKEQLRILKKHH